MGVSRGWSGLFLSAKYVHTPRNPSWQHGRIETGTCQILSLKLQRQVDAVNERKPFTISLARCSVWPQGLQSAMLQKQQHKYNIEVMRTEKERRSNFEAMQWQVAHQAAYYNPEESVRGSAGSFNLNTKKQPRRAWN